jgi:hypothetical protein
LSARPATRLSRALAWLLLAIALGGSATAAQPAERGDSARSQAHALEQAPPSFQEWVESLPESQRRPVLRRLGNMPAHRRSTLFRRWEAMEEGERRKFQAFLEERGEARERGEPPLSRAERRRRFEQLSPESREKLAPLVRRWRGMEPGERRRMRERLERFRMLSPEDQQALIEKRFSSRSPEERSRILEALRESSRALPDDEMAPIVPDPPLAE